MQISRRSGTHQYKAQLVHLLDREADQHRVLCLRSIAHSRQTMECMFKQRVLRAAAVHSLKHVQLQKLLHVATLPRAGRPVLMSPPMQEAGKRCVPARD